MKRTALDPTFENILETIKENRFGKNEDIVSFIKMMKNTEGAFNIALDGGWGTGKTFFIKQTKMAMDFLSGQYKEDYDTEEQSKIETLFSENSIVKEFRQRSWRVGISTANDFEKENWRTVYFDAWDHDSDEDPIGSLAYELALCGNGIDTTQINALNTLNKLIRIKTGLDISDLITHDSLIEEIKNERNVRKGIEKKIDDIIGERADRIIIFVDELDRCNPSYAVRLLERIKHYFNHERILFVFALNAEQLQHTIKAYYGSEFQGIGYLDKFFDLWMPMPEIKYDELLKDIKGEIKGRTGQVAREVMKYMKFSIREMDKYMQEVKDVYGAIEDQADRAIRRGIIYREIIFKEICLFLIGLKFKDISLFYNVMNGSDPKSLIEFLMQGNIKTSIMKDLRFQTDEEMEDGLKALYDMVFNKNSLEILDNKYNSEYFYTELGILQSYLLNVKQVIEQIVRHKF